MPEAVNLSVNASEENYKQPLTSRITAESVKREQTCYPSGIMMSGMTSVTSHTK
ncbi:hypothetical protein PAMP_008416 [Pampus punctatissimus]